MTQLVINLSPTLVNELKQTQNGSVNAYAVFFDPTTGSPQWTEIASGGIVSASTPVNLPQPYKSGKVYLIIQSASPSTPNISASGVIQQQSDIGANNASSYDFRYDSVELNLASSPFDVANLTEITGFGLPMELIVPYSNGTSATAGYHISGAEVVNTISAMSAGTTSGYSTGPLADSFRSSTAPSNQPGTFTSADWHGYVTSLETYTASHNVYLTGEFGGSTDANNVYHNPGYFAFQLTWDSANQVFRLTPLPSSTVQGSIAITEGNLENSIYAQVATFDVLNNSGGIYQPAATAGFNDQFSNLFKQLVTGLDAGYFANNAATSPNPQVSGAIDLDKSYNWNPDDAFISFTDSYQTYDPFTKLFTRETNAYGWSYQDNLMGAYVVGGVQIPIAEPGTAQDVPTISLTVFADTEQPQ